MTEIADFMVATRYEVWRKEPRGWRLFTTYADTLEDAKRRAAIHEGVFPVAIIKVTREVVPFPAESAKQAEA